MSEKRIDALKEYRRKVESGEIEPTVAKDPYEKLAENPSSLRYSINAFCYQCVCGVRSEVTLCSFVDCPLFNVRPWQSKRDDVEVNE